VVERVRQGDLKLSNEKLRPGKKPGKPYADLWSRPGFLVRQMHQIHLGLFLNECRDYEITPVQFAVLTVLYSGEAVDQITLSNSVGIAIAAPAAPMSSNAFIAASLLRSRRLDKTGAPSSYI
jgi:hypothetical protein